jgi:hypothetical protein
MSWEDFKAVVAEMPQERQDQLAAYLVYLRHQRDPKTPAELRTKIDDTNAANWLSLEELREKWKD